MTRTLALATILAACRWSAQAFEQPQVQPQLGRIERVYVEQLGGGQTSDQMRDMIVAALQNSRLFAITDNPERADAIMRGSADDKIYTEDHNMSESLGLRTNSGSGGATRSSSKQYGGAGITDNETSRIQERRHEASASIRLVDTAGDVIWSTTQESAGGKFRGAMADVADKITRQLADDIRKSRPVH